MQAQDAPRPIRYTPPMIPHIPLEVVEDAPSTSAILRDRAEAQDGAANEAALLARRQGAGRGRLGRAWASAEGNLHLSLLLRPAPPFVPGHWSLLVGLALAGCVARRTAGVRLKWPNDVLLHGGKLAGVLIEAGGDPAWLVIGCGVNLVAAPHGLGRPVACLRDHCVAPAPEDFARELIDAIAAWRARYAVEGFEPVRDAWLAFGPAPGDTVAVGSAVGRIEGRFAGIGAQGALLLDQDGVVRTVVSGEVE